jgi:hypothetical protein
MPVAVGIDKSIRNGYIESVNCTCRQDVFVAFRNNQLYHTCLSYEGYVKIAFYYKTRTRKTREHCDGINDKLHKMTYLNLINNRFICYTVPLYLHLRYFRTRLSRGYLKVNCV